MKLCIKDSDRLELIPKCEPDIVLMDIQLPNLSGIECTARLKQLLPSFHIIVITVYEDTDRIFKALHVGSCGYLLKRYTSEEIVSAIREVRQGGGHMSPGNRSQSHQFVSRALDHGHRGRGPHSPKKRRFSNYWRKAFPTRKSPIAAV
jgi:DNA-binding NarL/FixJ family response regulator